MGFAAGWLVRSYYIERRNMYGVPIYGEPAVRLVLFTEAKTREEAIKFADLPGDWVEAPVVFATNTETRPQEKAEPGRWKVTILPSGQMAAFGEKERVPTTFKVIYEIDAISPFHAVEEVINQMPWVIR